MNKLWGMRAYLAGGIDRVDDLGAWWRNDMTPFLEEMGVVVLNPLKKPIDIGIEDSKHVAKRREFKRKNVWVLLSDDMRKLRVVDLRMCDMSDFLVVYIDPATHMCGTYEEVSWANRLKRPILCCVVGGRSNCPDWLFGMIPYQHIFDCWNDLKLYLRQVNSGEDTRHFKRWMFFEYHKMLPKTPYQGKEIIKCCTE